MTNPFGLETDRRSLSEQAYEAIRDMILSLRLEPGRTVYENELANLLSMSRTPIREAVRTLLVEELMEVLPQRGMKVALISEKKVEEARFVRESLEVSALRAAMARWQSDATRRAQWTHEVEEAITAQRQAADAGDVLAFLEADEAFHRVLMAAADNRTLVSIVTQMRAHLNRVRTLSLQELQNVSTLIEEHEQLVSVLAAGDEEQAVSLLTRHLRRLKQDVAVVRSQYPQYFRD
ncbi:GntR family transcriptional regulator [Alicyclobacillus herbarius]|uniref:GntR family transcriptional regulator n=1 Tax=Alicyclobacillus herbarius TaxID=122960 RepID=UPI000401B1A9|nr:GntR family transcriptional regulator [Alicyclobacillus herbarius]